MEQPERRGFERVVLREDRDLVDSRRDGLRSAASLGLPIERYQTVLDGKAPEAGVAHFHEWYRARMHVG